MLHLLAVAAVGTVCHVLDSLPANAVCMEGTYPLFFSEELANAESPNGEADAYEYGPYTLWLARNHSFAQVNQTTHPTCPSHTWDVAIIVNHNQSEPICINGTYPLFTTSCAANAFSPVNQSRPEVYGNYTLFIPEPE